MAKAKRSKIVDRLMKGALRAAEIRGGPAAFLQGKRILLVDDQPSGMQRVIAVLRVVGGYDLEISSARTATAAIDICLAHDGAFDIALLNYVLGPADDGIMLLAMLQRAGLAATAKTVLFSSAMSRSVDKQAIAAGFDATIHSDDIDPLSLRDLLAALVDGAAPT